MASNFKYRSGWIHLTGVTIPVICLPPNSEEDETIAVVVVAPVSLYFSTLLVVEESC